MIGIFCENLEANRFREITRSRFEARVLKIHEFLFGSLCRLGRANGETQRF